MRKQQHSYFPVDFTVLLTRLEEITSHNFYSDMNIYVGNLDFKVNENDLKNIFEEYGSVSEVRIIKDKYSGRSKGFAFVTMTNSTEGNQAISELNGATLENREMIVNEAREKKERGNQTRR